MCFAFCICICISWTRPGKANLSWIWQSAGLRWRLTEWLDRELGKWPKSILPHIIADPKLHTVEHRCTHFNPQIDTVEHRWTHLTHSWTQMSTLYTQLNTDANTLIHKYTQLNTDNSHNAWKSVSFPSDHSQIYYPLLHWHVETMNIMTICNTVEHHIKTEQSTVLKSFPMQNIVDGCYNMS